MKLDLYLLQVQFSLDFLKVAGVIDDRTRELCLNVGQPGTQAAHVLIQLLHSYQSLPQFFCPVMDDRI